MRILQVQWIALSVLCSLLLSFWVSFVKFYNSVNSSVQYLAECRLVHSLVFSPLSVLAYKECPQYVGEVKPPSLQWYRTFEIGIAVYLFGYPILFLSVQQLPYPFVFIFNADSRAEGVEFPTLYASRLSDIFFNASFCRFGRFRFGCFKKGREWVEQGFSKKKYYPQGWRFFLKTIEHPNPGFTFAPRTGTIHLMRLPERPSKWR